MIVQDCREPRMQWMWHPDDPHDEFPLSEYTRAIRYECGIRLEHRVFPGIDVIQLDRAEMQALLEVLILECSDAE